MNISCFNTMTEIQTLSLHSKTGDGAVVLDGMLTPFISLASRPCKRASSSKPLPGSNAPNNRLQLW